MTYLHVDNVRKAFQITLNIGAAIGAFLLTAAALA